MKFEEIFTVLDDAHEDWYGDWPNHGQRFPVIFDVYADGDDTYYRLHECDYRLRNCCDNSINYVNCDIGGQLPISSGRYMAIFYVMLSSWRDWETGYRETEVSFDVSEVLRIGEADWDEF